MTLTRGPDGKVVPMKDMDCCKKMPMMGAMNPDMHQGMKDMGGMAAMDHAGHTSAAGADMNEATRALDEAMADMHKAMMVPYTGDADIDFLRGMIPHHQGAIDMAKIQLQYGKDAQVKRLAREIIRAQEQEIRWMNRWADQLEAKAKGPGADENWLGKHTGH